ncbi:MAG: hypothetical protein WC891_03060 [Actinomycetota bacterium]
MTNVQAWAFIVGFVLPYVIVFLNQAGWSKWANFGVTLVACVLAGLGTVYFAGSLSLAHPDVGTIVQTIVIVLTASQAVYKMYFKNAVDSWLNVPTSFIKPPG